MNYKYTKNNPTYKPTLLFKMILNKVKSLIFSNILFRMIINNKKDCFLFGLTDFISYVCKDEKNNTYQRRGVGSYEAEHLQEQKEV